MQINSSKQLTLLVGKTSIPVLVNSAGFRRAIREAAQKCVANHSGKGSDSRTVNRSKHLLQQAYQRGLTYLLTMQLNDELSTKRLLNCIDERRYGPESSMIPWDALRDLQTVLKRESKRDVRLKRIAHCEAHCRETQIDEGIQDFEDSVEFHFRILKVNLSKSDPSPEHQLSGETKTTLVRTPIPWDAIDPPLVFGSDGAFFGRSAVHPRDLTHVLALGGTGVGKTESVTKPAVAAALAYELFDGTKSAVLVIDPKTELIEKVKSVLTARGEMNRLFVVGDHPPIKLFTSGSPLSQSDRLQKLRAYVPKADGSNKNEYWKQLGDSMLLDFMQLEEIYATKTGGHRLLRTLAVGLKLAIDDDRGYWQSLRDVLAYSCTGPQKLKETSELLRRHCRVASIVSSSMQVMQTYTASDSLIEQWNYVVMSAQPTIAALANPDLSLLVNLDILGDTNHSGTDVSELMEMSKVIIFCPQPKSSHDIAAKALKDKFYEASLSRKNLKMGVFIVIDEAHRFITDDPKSQSSEASFIDVCRAYRVNMILATQSLGSIKRALGSDNAAQDALDIICQNTPTKVVFRCNDTDTVIWLKSQIPQPADGSPHVISVRPPSGLEPGEAYNLWADGTWSRQRARLSGLA